MVATLTSRALLWTAILAALVPSSAAFSYDREEDGPVNVTRSQDIFSAESEAKMSANATEEGEGHGDIKVPDGAKFTSFAVNQKGNEEIAGFISEDYNMTSLEHLYIVIHGRLRDGNGYWKTLHNAIKDAREDNFSGTDRKMAVLAPQFFSKKYNLGQYESNQLAWDDLNAWQPGGQASHPENTTLTSFDVLDGLVKLHSDKTKYPSLTNVTVVGHGGGGQLAQRYSAVGSNPPDNVHLRYIHGDPSSCMYFTKDRPILPDTKASNETCNDFNVWRYGFDKFPGTADKPKTPKEYFAQYVSRDVVSIVGIDDTGSSGDTSCMAQVQGGINRRARNLVWYRYINELARTDEELDGFPGSFEDLPDWSDAVNGTSRLRLVAVQGVAHNADKLFATKLGRGALFHDRHIDGGWRPEEDDN